MADRPRLIVTTGNEVAGHEIVEYLGIVRGIVVRATSISQGIRGAFKSIVGGNGMQAAGSQQNGDQGAKGLHGR